MSEGKKTRLGIGPWAPYDGWPVTQFLAFLSDWWPFFFLIYLPHLMRMASRLVAALVQSRLDHKFPDELPRTAGEWLEEMLERNGLSREVRAVAVEGDGILSIDGYNPREGVIQLTAETYFKKDPIYWGIAGHEFGHALFRRRHRWLSALFSLVGWIKWALATFGLAIIVGNVLYGMPQVTSMAYYCLIGALILDVFVLVDEAIASALADKLLQREGVLTPAHLRGARLFLFAAFMTYFSAFASHAILLTQWGRLVELIGQGRFAQVAEPLQGWRSGFMVIISICGLMVAALVIKRIFLPPRNHIAREDHVLSKRDGCVAPLLKLHWEILLIVLLVLAWDLSADPVYWWCVLLAFIPTLGWIFVIFGLPLSLVVGRIRALQERMIQRYGRIEDSRVYRDARSEGKDKTRLGNELVSRIVAHALNHPPLSSRLGSLARLLYLPLIVAYWLMLG
jgi:Zn-dependent membrane protease YugP